MMVSPVILSLCVLVVLVCQSGSHSALIDNADVTASTSTSTNNAVVIRKEALSIMASTTTMLEPSSAAVAAIDGSRKLSIQLPNLPAIIQQAWQRVLTVLKSLLPGFLKRSSNSPMSSSQSLESVSSPAEAATPTDFPPLPVEPRTNSGNNHTTQSSMSLRNQSWAGKNITEQETLQIQELRDMITAHIEWHSQWIYSVQDIELLRFLRSKNHHIQNTWKMIIKHDQWRVSTYGAESSFVRDIFNNDNGSDAKNPLRKEAFWLGPNQHHCPTLVIRTQVHDGYYYNDDARIYVAYIVHLLEEGKALYGVGLQNEFCVLLDRAGTVYKNGELKVDKFDKSVIPALVELFRLLYATILDNYPELVKEVKIAPTSWFFSFCYAITSRVMSASHRAMFQMISADDLTKTLHPWMAKENLPEHLGGNSTTYTSVVNIDFEPHKSRFPITTTPGHRKPA